MGKRAVERRLRRQARKGGLKPRTMQKLMNKSIRMGPPPTPEPKTVMVKQRGKVDVEQYQDQVVRKFGGGQIKKQAGGPVSDFFLRYPKQKKRERGYGQATEGKPTLSKGGKIKAKKSGGKIKAKKK